MFNINTATSDYMSLIVTHECNKKCPFCIDKYRGNKEYISMGNVYRAMRFAFSSKIKDILIVGGEPTLHPKILEITRIVKSYGFNVILTTNYSKPEIVKSLDKYIDSFNISFYNQTELPNQDLFTADVTLSALITKKTLHTKEKLDSFIDKYRHRYNLKFSTITVCNKWTKENQIVNYLDDISEKDVVLFNEIRGTFYRGFIIKRYDRIINKNAWQSFRCHVDGEISKSWNREGK